MQNAACPTELVESAYTFAYMGLREKLILRTIKLD